MKEALNPSQPSRLWIARHLAYGAALEGAKWCQAGLQGVDQKKFIGFTTYFSRKVIIVVAAALALIMVPCVTASVLASIVAELGSNSTAFDFSYRSIEMSPVNIKSFKIAASNVTDERRQRQLQRYWTEAVEHANKTHSESAMVDSYTVDILLESISRNKKSPRNLMIGALVEVLSAGGSDTQAMEKARHVLSLGQQVVGADSFIISQLGPVQSCKGIPLFKTLTAPMRMTSVPTGPCSNLNLLDGIRGFLGGLVVTFMLALMVYFIVSAAKKFTRLLIQMIDQKMKKRAGEITAIWEARQVEKAIIQAVSATKKSRRL